MTRFAWQARFWTLMGFFIPAVVYTLGVILALWLVGSLIVGTVVLARELAEVLA